MPTVADWCICNMETGFVNFWETICYSVGPVGSFNLDILIQSCCINHIKFIGLCAIKLNWQSWPPDLIVMMTLLLTVQQVE